MSDPVEHYHYAPSSGYIWMECGGSTTVDVSDVNDEDQYSGRGSLLHDLGHQMLMHGSYNVPAGQARTKTEWYSFDPEEDAASVKTYVDYVNGRQAGAQHVILEERTEWIKDCGGTTDCAIFFADGLLEVIDYKAGFVKHDPEQNYQMGIYALGILKKYSALFDVKRVRMTIVQPMHLNEGEEPPFWDIPLAELVRFGKRIRSRVEKLQAGDPKAIAFKPRRDLCRFCTVGRANRCPALDAEAVKAAKDDFAGYGDDPLPDYAGKPISEMTELELYEMAGVVEIWARNRKESVTSRVKLGTHVPGFKLVAGKKQRSVADRAGLVAHLTKDGFEEKDIFVGEPTLVSPAQAEKLYKGKGSGAKKKELAQFFDEEDGPPQVAPEYDHRPEVDPLASAQRDFADFQKE